MSIEEPIYSSFSSSSQHSANSIGSGIFIMMENDYHIYRWGGPVITIVENFYRQLINKAILK